MSAPLPPPPRNQLSPRSNEEKNRNALHCVVCGGPKIRSVSLPPPLGPCWVHVSRWNILICFTRMFVSTCWPALLLFRQSPAAGFHYVIMLSPADWGHPLPQSVSLSPPPCFSWLPTHLPAAEPFQFRNSSEVWKHTDKPIQVPKELNIWASLSSRIAIPPTLFGHILSWVRDFLKSKISRIEDYNMYLSQEMLNSSTDCWWAGALGTIATALWTLHSRVWSSPWNINMALVVVFIFHSPVSTLE